MKFRNRLYHRNALGTGAFSSNNTYASTLSTFIIRCCFPAEGEVLISRVPMSKAQKTTVY